MLTSATKKIIDIMIATKELVVSDQEKVNTDLIAI